MHSTSHRHKVLAAVLRRLQRGSFASSRITLGSLCAWVLLCASFLGTSSLQAQVNTLSIRPSEAAPGTGLHKVEILGLNYQEVSGYTIALSYNNAYIEAVDMNLDGTLAEAVGAEFANFQNYDDEGFFIFAVLLDLIPPYAGQIIPIVPELELVFGNFVCNIKDQAAEVDEVPLVFVDGVGSPAVSNMFVVDYQSVAPVLQSGVIDIVDNVSFVRGDANADGLHDVADAVTLLSYLLGIVDEPACLKVFDVNDDGLVDHADPVYELNFLFQNGPIIPEPFPMSGLDPTPDELPCEESG